MRCFGIRFCSLDSTSDLIVVLVVNYFGIVAIAAVTGYLTKRMKSFTFNLLLLRS